MRRRPLFLLATALAVRGAVVEAQAARAVAEPYAGRLARAYARLGNDLLIIRSAGAPAGATAPGFRQNSSFFYFTGASSTLGAILVLDGEAKRSELFLPKQLPPSVQFFAPRQAGAARAVADSFHVERISEWDGFARYIDDRLSSGRRTALRVDDGGDEAQFSGTVGTPLDSLMPLQNPSLAWAREIKKQWPTATFQIDHDIAVAVRSVKDSGEIATLRRVADASAAAVRSALTRFAPGRRQREVVAAVVETCTLLGDGPSFWPWACPGRMRCSRWRSLRGPIHTCSIA